MQVIFTNWERSLRIAYGTDVESEEELFIRHTYLSMLAKLLVWLKLDPTNVIPESKDLLEILNGKHFEKYGIKNFLEEDYFSWVSRDAAQDVGLNVAEKLTRQLQTYDLSKLSEDVLRGLYQELVDPETRHDLGEYYTPSWLAERMVKRFLEKSPSFKVLDPACGSGTFLYAAIRYKLENLPHTQGSLESILETVYGIDIHPLAVTISKANYLLALGEFVKHRSSHITIPVYLANSIKPPERDTQWISEHEVTSYYIKLEGEKERLRLPGEVVENPNLFDEAVEACNSFAVNNKETLPEGLSLEDFKTFLSQRHSSLQNLRVSTVNELFDVSKTLHAFMLEGRDTIWAYVFSNYFRAVSLYNNFDLLIGNPPWLSYRYVDVPEYQARLKYLITSHNNLLKGRGELITHLELATLFYVRCAELYLKEKGRVAFVLPRSVFSADQHSSLRKGGYTFPSVGFEEIWDLDKVSPLFEVPSCVVVGRRDTPVSYPVKGEILSGKLGGGKEHSLEEIERKISEGQLKVSEAQWVVSRTKNHTCWTRKEEEFEFTDISPYAKKVKEGASIVPRNFWFVRIKEAGAYGLDSKEPLVYTDPRAEKEAKKAYKGVKFERQIESQFLFNTLLSTDVVPFGYLEPRLVVLPLIEHERVWSLLNTNALHGMGCYHMKAWLAKAQETWEKKRSAKSKNNTVGEWLNYRNKLTGQSPKARYRVLHVASATNLCSCVVDINEVKNRFVVESKTYYFEAKTQKEADYLCAVLNSDTLNKLIKPLQTKGLQGERDIHKRVWEFPIPLYDDSKPRHVELAKLGRECAKKVKAFLENQDTSTSIGRLRGFVRKEIAQELKDIEKIVKKIIK